MIMPITGIGFSLIAIGMVFFLYSPFKIWVFGIITKISLIKNSERMMSFLNNLQLKDKTYALLVPLIGLTIFWQVIFILRVFLLYKSMGLPLSVFDAAWMSSLVLLLQVLPVSLAGIGIREGAYAYLFTLLRIPAENGLLIGLLIFSQMLLLAGLGFVLNLFEK